MNDDARRRRLLLRNCRFATLILKHLWGTIENLPK
jgi:hypothetical protein